MPGGSNIVGAKWAPNEGFIKSGSAQGLVKTLGTTERAMGVNANNSANANTDGYVRLNTKLVATSYGVMAQVSRCAERHTQREMWHRNSEVGYCREYHDVLSELEQIISRAEGTEEVAEGGPEAKDIAGAMDKFHSSLAELQTDPENAEKKEKVRYDAQVLASRLSSAMTRTEQTKQRLEESVEKQAGRINELLEKIGKLNIKISNFSMAGRPVPALEDERERAISELSELIPIDVEYRTVATNGYAREMCEVSLKDMKGLQLRRAGGPGILSDAERKLVGNVVEPGGRISVAKFEVVLGKVANTAGVVDLDRRFLTFTCAKSIDANGTIVNGVPVGNSKNGAAVVAGSGAGYDFQDYMERACNHGGKLSATLNLLRNPDGADPRVEGAENIEGVGNKLDGIGAFLVDAMGVANNGTALFAWKNDADHSEGVKVADDWRDDAEEINTDHVANVLTAWETEDVDGNGRSIREHIDYIRRIVGQNTKELEMRCDKAKQELEVAKDRAESVSGVNTQETMVEMAKLVALHIFVGRALQMFIQMWQRDAELLG